MLLYNLRSRSVDVYYQVEGGEVGGMFFESWREKLEDVVEDGVAAGHDGLRMSIICLERR